MRILDVADGVVLCVDAQDAQAIYASTATRAPVGEPFERWRERPGCRRRLFDPEDCRWSASRTEATSAARRKQAGAKVTLKISTSTTLIRE